MYYLLPVLHSHIIILQPTVLKFYREPSTSLCITHTYILECTNLLIYITILDTRLRPHPSPTHTEHNQATLLTYLLTPWCRVLLEKLTGLQLVKKFPAFHGTQRFITALTSVRHLSLFWASQSSPYTHILPPGDPA